MTTWSTSPSSSAGPGHRRPHEQQHVGTTPDASRERPGHPAPRVQRGDAFAHVGARGVERPTSGMPELAREPHGPLDGLALGGADRAAVLAAGDAEPADRAGRRSRASRRRPRRCGARRRASTPGAVTCAAVGRSVTPASTSTGAEDQRSRCGRRSRTSSTATGAARTARGAPRDDVEPDVVADLLEVRGRRDDAVAHREQARSTASAAPAPRDQVTGDALGRRDRRGRRRRTPCGSPRPRPRR